MCFIMSEKVNHDITHASQVILFRYKYTEVYGTRKLALSLFKSSSKRELKSLRKSSVPDALLPVIAYRKSNF